MHNSVTIQMMPYSGQHRCYDNTDHVDVASWALHCLNDCPLVHIGHLHAVHQYHVIVDPTEQYIHMNIKRWSDMYVHTPCVRYSLQNKSSVSVENLLTAFEKISGGNKNDLFLVEARCRILKFVKERQEMKPLRTCVIIFWILQQQNMVS